MKLEDVKVGMKVRIAKDCQITSSNHGFNGEMKDMQGKIGIIRSIIDKGSVRIGEWQWHVLDLTPSEPIFLGPPIKHPKPQTFDPTLLDT